MTLPASQLPKGAPVARAAIESDFARRVLGRREARRLAELMDEAETRARRRMADAQAEIEAIFAEAKAEAEAILLRLPDFAALEGATRGTMSALSIIRRVADRHGFSVAIVTGYARSDLARAARDEAICALGAAGFAPGQIAPLFSRATESTVRRVLRKGDPRTGSRGGGSDDT